ARIRAGTFPAGYRLPAARALADEIGAHRNTVVRAYVSLEAAGFVTSTVGRGTFVAKARPGPKLAPPRASEAGGLPWAALLSRATAAEPLSRFDRLQTAYGPEPRDAVNLARLAPSPDLLPVELLRRCFEHVFRRLGARALAYAPRDGLPRLRGLIAEDLRAQGVPADASCVLVTNGSQQAIDLVVRLLVDPGDAFFVDAATYTGATSALLDAGARPIAVPCDGEGPSLAFLERHGRSGAKGLYTIPNSHNPTGLSLSTERREALVAWAQRAGVPLVEDDYAGDIQLGDAPIPPALRALDRDVIYIGTFSKKLVPALRVGFILCPEPLRAPLATLKHALDLGTSGLVQHALAEFLERGYMRAHLARVVPAYRARRDALEAALAAHLPRGLRVRHAEQGLLVWLPLPPGLAADAVTQEARRGGVLVGSSSLFTTGAETPQGLRLTFCAEPPDRLIEGAKRLGKAISALLPVARAGPGSSSNGAML
ncbi:MAG TPA: PLP-dependent aminotransferase family protein, partial [Minicystis sp.]|nr:PLP-dependent aminotransferase family protein [Minicystis sp.]